MTYLSPWLTKFSEIWYILDLTPFMKPLKISVKLVHLGLIYGRSDGTYEVKKEHPLSIFEFSAHVASPSDF